MSYILSKNYNNDLNNLNNIKNKKNIKKEWDIKITDFARNTHNPIRAVVEGLRFEPNPEKQMIALSIGDPTTFGNLCPAQEIVDAVRKVIDEGQHNGYTNTAGMPSARKAIAEYVSPHQGKVESQDVILCSGCSSALDICLSVLVSAGQNILIPRPGFSIYRTLTEGFDVEIRSYNLLPERNWEIDLKSFESLIDDNTAAIVLNNPSNPCGSVFSKEHILDILDIAEKYFVPIIADEIYEHFVFPGNEFYAVSSLSKNVPVLSCGGLTKRFLVPGWRQGWVIIHDRNNAFEEVKKGLNNLSTRIMGSNTLIQAAIPDILKNTPQIFFDNVVSTLHYHAKLAYDFIKEIRGLKPVMPSGAMYMMIEIDVINFPKFSNELHFVQDLVKEQSVFCLPGQCFDYPNYMRIVLTVPEEMIREACLRIAEFCEKYYKIDNRVIENNLMDVIEEF